MKEMGARLFALAGIVIVGLLFVAPKAGAQARLILEGSSPETADTARTEKVKEARGLGVVSEQQKDTLAVGGGKNEHLMAVNDSLLKSERAERKRKKTALFVPNPKRALWLSLVFPGAGQIYNRKYWKLPIIYGGFLGCTYALMWNQQMYRDYSQAYLDIMDDDPNTHSYLDMLPPRYDITGREEQFKNIFKRKKDYYRRYRDLSAFCFVGVYLLAVIDAYVDAQLSVFDISPDLSMRLEPAVISTNGSSRGGSAYGVGCSLNF